MPTGWAFVDQPSKITKLRVLLGEALRASTDPPTHFVPPYEGALEEVTSKRHQLVFGRRGSGKTSLLRKAQSHYYENGWFCAYINVEPLKTYTLADQIIGAQILLLEQFLSRKHPLFAKLSDELVGAINREISELDALQRTPEVERSESPIPASNKLEEMRRRILSQRRLLTRVFENQTGPSAIVLDDLYHLSVNTQPYFIDHFHSLVKGLNVWLKIGTLKTRSVWHWQHGGQTFGLEIPNDADEINLDKSFEQFKRTRQLLQSIMNGMAAECGLTSEDVATDGAFNRLVQASGGVARDFLSLLRATILDTQERIASECADGVIAGTPRISADDTWRAAAQLDLEKRAQFRQTEDRADPEIYLLKLGDIRAFCLANKCHCFLVQRTAPPTLIDEVSRLWDAKFLHIVEELFRFDNEDFTVYSLDVGVVATQPSNQRDVVVDLNTPNIRKTFQRRGLIFAK